jgi:hypothetical protein
LAILKSLQIHVPVIGLKETLMFQCLAFAIHLWLHSVVLSPHRVASFLFTGELEILRPVGVARLALLDGNVGNK